jgi:hypothetical protein
MADTQASEQVVNPWEARAAEGANKIDYDKIIGIIVLCTPEKVVMFLQINSVASVSVKRF